ncbi:MAG: hypothetical protein ACFB0B_18480 [Thermonemataceae bacterium]
MGAPENEVAFDYLKIYDEATGELLLEENFDNYDNGWRYYVASLQEAKLKEGAYVMEGSPDYHNHDYPGYAPILVLSSIPISPGNNYEVIVRSQWQRGETAPYGFALEEKYLPKENPPDYFYRDKKNTHTFYVKSNGEAWMRTIKDQYRASAIASDIKKTASVSTGENTIEQRVVVKGSEVTYYVNDELIASYDYRVEAASLVLLLNGNQTVAFDYIEIK